MKKKYAHISLLPTCSAGIVSKLDGCASDAVSRDLPIDYIVIAPVDSKATFNDFTSIRLVLTGGEDRLSKRISQFVKLKKVMLEYEKVILRYPGADLGPFVLGGNLGKCIAEHHTLIIEEQKQNSVLRAFFEKIIGGAWLSFFGGHAAVTAQILQDVRDRLWFGASNKVMSVLPNPYRFSASYRGGSFKKKDVYTAVISASTFMSWHGLDRVVELFRNDSEGRCRLLVVGDSMQARSLIPGIDSIDAVSFLGRKNKAELAEVYAACDFAFNSFGLDRLGMIEGSTLKLREYLSYSLPVISPLPDGALPNDFPYLIRDFTTLSSICAQLDMLENVTYQKIRSEAEKYLGVGGFNDKAISMLDAL